MGVTKKVNPQYTDAISLNWPVQMSGHSVVEIGLSGGLDSVVLLDLLDTARETHELTLSAVYVHHGLSDNADDWAAHCHRLCRERQIPLRIEKVSVSPCGDGIESAARRARYAIYRQSRAQTIALAQHLDDQIETLLLQTLRGGGPHALAAMPLWRQLSDHVALWRPLLHVTRDQLATHAQKKGLSWVDDESNDDQRYRRNWIRHSITPLLAAQSPDYRQALQRCAWQMADAAAMLDELAASDLQQSTRQGRLQLNELVALSEPRQRQLLLRWVMSHSLGTPAPTSVENFRRQLLSAAIDRQPVWSLPNGQVHRYRHELWTEPTMVYTLPATSICQPETKYLPEWGGSLHWRRSAYGLPDDLLKQGLVLRKLEPGIKMTTAAGRKPLKQLFQEAGIPPFLRKRWPLLYTTDDQAAALPSVTIDTSLHVPDGWQPLWLPDGCLNINQD